MNRGYIKLYRKIIDSRVFHNEGLLKVWIWCLVKANHEGAWVSIKIGRSITEVWVESGQFVFGRHSAAKELKMAPSTVWKRIIKLKNMRNCDINSNSKYTIITIINWPIYQGNEKKGDIKGDRQVTGKEQASDTNKNEKNEKNINISSNEDLCPHGEIIELYHEILPELQKIKLWTPDRRKQLRARWNEDKKRQSLDYWKKLFEYIRESNFLLGENDRGWQANLEWIIKKKSFINIIEGKYHRIIK